MGNTIDSKCRICNFENTFNYGGNKSDYKTNCPVPALNMETNEFENINFINNQHNLKYKFYSSKELKGDNEGKTTIKNFNLELNQVNNYCPRCKNFTLDFRIICFSD